jgi:hypothetical protein
LPFTLARDFKRRKFVLNKLPAVGSLWFFHVSLSRPEFTFASATGAAKRFERFEDFQIVRWLGPGKLFGEVGEHGGNLCGGSAIGKAISGRGLRGSGTLAGIVSRLRHGFSSRPF